jgi:hexosaminidase
VTFLLLAPLLASVIRAQQDDSMFASGKVTCEGREYPYRLLAPAQTEANARYPLVVYLHGAGERGDDNKHQLAWLPRTMAEPANRAAFPCFLLAVQCPTNQRWVEVPWGAKDSTPLPEQPSPAISAVMQAMQRIRGEQPIDPTRIYLTGLSMGGYGSFDLACRHPEWFAAVAPICGGGDERQAERLAGLPCWIWHGDADPAVPVIRSRTMVAAIQQFDPAVRYTELPGIGHDSWRQAYGEQGLLPWLFEQRRPEAPVAAFVPWPTTVITGNGETNDVYRLGKQISIGYDRRSSGFHAQHLATELQTLTGATTVVDEGQGNITLVIDPSLPAGGYRLVIATAIRVVGSDLQGLAAGTTAMLQALRQEGNEWTAPVMQVSDTPEYAFRAVLVDCARHFQSVTTLRRLIELCRLYRVQTLVMHLSDHEAFRFPSQLFPQIASEPHYTLAELRDLVYYAMAAGVTLVPEIDLPGHSSALVHAEPTVFGLADHVHHGSIVNLGRESTREALAQLLGEVAAVFGSSPWFHLGGDEVDLSGVAEDPDCKARMQALGVEDTQELYRDFLLAMHKVVQKLGKQTLVWEGFARGGKVQMPKDITVIAWESAYYPPDQLIADGFTVINASWQPLYVVGGGRLPPHAAPRRWSAEHLYRWQPRRWEHFAPGYPTFGGMEVAADAPVLGAMMCVWEQEDGTAVAHLRQRLAAFAERTWNPNAKRGLGDFLARLRVTDQLVERLLPPGDDGNADEWSSLQKSGTPRVRYRLFAAPPAGFENIPDFATMTAYASGTLPILRGGPQPGPLGMVLEATLQVPAAGDYTFRLESCDGPAKLFLGDKLVCDHSQRGHWEGIEAAVTLRAGDIQLRIDSAQGVFSTLCRVQWRAPGSKEFQLIDPALRPIE